MPSPICGFILRLLQATQPLRDDPPGASLASRGLGEADVLSGGVKDGVVLPDEDVAQDPQLLRAAPPEAGGAFVVALRGGGKQKGDSLSSQLHAC